MADKFVKPRVSTGIETSYMEIAIDISFVANPNRGDTVTKLVRFL